MMRVSWVYSVYSSILMIRFNTNFKFSMQALNALQDSLIAVCEVSLVGVIRVWL